MCGIYWLWLQVRVMTEAALFRFGTGDVLGVSWYSVQAFPFTMV